LRPYEMMYILHPQLSDEDLTTTIDQVSRYVTNLGGEFNQIIREAPWGRRRLAYTIRHNGQDLRDGFYILFHYDLDARQVADVERLLRLNEGVVRYMVVKVDEKKAAKQAEAAAKHAAYVAAEESRRPERPGGGRDRDRDRDRY